MRLVRKDKRFKDGYFIPEYYCIYEKDVFNKLGRIEGILENHKIETLEELDGLLSYVKQIKDIEQELGIDLITLFEILRTGGHIWVKNCKGVNYWHVESLKQRGLDKQWYLTYSNNVRVKLKDYGNTWALTERELINEKEN